jgi:hypothetical protein
MDECVKTTKRTLAGHRFDRIIDPCVGPATYLDSIRKYFRGVEISCSDIDPQESWIEQRDFLENPHFEEAPKERILTFCNPPFGGLVLSDAFIRNVLKFSQAAAFIIPRSYMNRDHSYSLAEDDCWRIIEEVELPADIFTVNGKPFSWKCILQIWWRGDSPRRNTAPQQIEATRGYSLVTAKTSRVVPDLWIVKMGAKAGKVAIGKGSRNSRWGVKISRVAFKKSVHKARIRDLINHCGGFKTCGSRNSLNRADVTSRLNILMDYFSETNEGALVC